MTESKHVGHSELAPLQKKKDSASLRWPRFRFLLMNSLFLLGNVVMGVIVCKLTNSLAVKLDFSGVACSLIGSIVNIMVEFAKVRFADRSIIVGLDIAGCVLSLVLLMGVGVSGVVVAVERERHSMSFAARIQNPVLMLIYSSVDVFANTTILVWFVCIKDQLQASVTHHVDLLNLSSCLAHNLADVVGGLVLLGTSLWVFLTYPADLPAGAEWPKMAFVSQVDAGGTFLVCACIFASVCFLVRDMAKIFVHDGENACLAPSRA